MRQQRGARAQTGPLGDDIAIQQPPIAGPIPTASGNGAHARLDQVPIQHGLLSRATKRAIDIVGAGLALLILSPILLLIMIAIRLDSHGSPLFRQPRVGRDGRVFSMLKFRTMSDGADQLRAELNHINENDGILFKSSRDPRVTRMGRLLRPASLDELPQLVQVLSGTMSLVGPRPMPPDMDRLIDDSSRSRLLMRPGITGIWQIDRTDARRSIHEMAKLDAAYVRSWSLWSDAKILLRTIPYVFQRRGV